MTGWVIAGLSIVGTLVVEMLFTRIRRLRDEVAHNRALLERILDRLPPER